MVGTTGFEPATSRTPSVRATRLRYVPTARSAYHSDSRTVNKERSESRRSSKVLRLSMASCCDAACGAAGSLPLPWTSLATSWAAASPFVPFSPSA